MCIRDRGQRAYFATGRGARPAAHQAGQMCIRDRKIRACGRADGKEIPIVALTANAYPSDVNQSLAAGMNAHAAKPIDPDALYALMQKYME